MKVKASLGMYLARALLLTVGIVNSTQAATYGIPVTGVAPVLVDRYPPRRTPFPDGVIGLSDIVYSTIPGYRPLTLDLYLPPARLRARNSRRALVIYIHGGGWTSGQSRQSGTFEDWPRVLASIADRGYVVSSLNYRLSAEAPFPAAEQDVKSAIRWLRSHANDYGIDKSRVLVWGGSAGGHLAALAAVTCGLSRLEPAVDVAAASAATPGMALESDCVQGAVTWYGIFDLRAMLQFQAESDKPIPSSAANPMTRFLGCSPPNCSAEILRLASPISFVTRDAPPMLLIHGTDDHTVPYSQSEDFYQALKHVGGSVDLLPMEGVAHSFIGNTANSTRQASLTALKKTIEFIDATIGPSAR